MLLEHALVRGRIGADEGDDLRDVHALVAHALHVLHHVEQRGDQAEIRRDGRLRGEHREQALVHLEVAAVQDVVVRDDDAGQLHVLVLNRLDRAVERLDDEVEPVERSCLERLEVVLVVHPGLLWRFFANRPFRKRNPQSFCRSGS